MAPEGFSARFGSGSDEVTEGVRTLAADFRSVLWDVEWYPCLLFKSTFCAGMGLLKFRYKKPNMGDMSGRHVVTNVYWIWNL